MSTFDERRSARAGWPIRKTALGDESLTDERLTTNVDERVAMVAVLTSSQWVIGGKPFPRYSREDMPGRVIRPTR